MKCVFFSDSPTEGDKGGPRPGVTTFFFFLVQGALLLLPNSPCQAVTHSASHVRAPSPDSRDLRLSSRNTMRPSREVVKGNMVFSWVTGTFLGFPFTTWCDVSFMSVLGKRTTAR